MSDRFIQCDVRLSPRNASRIAAYCEQNALSLEEFVQQTLEHILAQEDIDRILAGQKIERDPPPSKSALYPTQSRKGTANPL